MLIRLHLREVDLQPRAGIRWGWFFLSITLLLGAGYFIYPVAQSVISDREAERQNVQPRTNQAPEPVIVAPVRKPVATKPPSNKTQRVTSLPAGPPISLRETAPEVPEGIRNRISGLVAIDVTVQINAQGHVAGAHATPQQDGVGRYLAQQALAAVREWRFAPSRPGVKTVHFQFYPSGAVWN